jgi:hypothetical protein
MRIEISEKELLALQLAIARCPANRPYYETACKFTTCAQEEMDAQNPANRSRDESVHEYLARILTDDEKGGA